MAEFKAHKHSVRMSPRKGRLVADLIRGKKVGEAVAILKNLETTCAEPILKTLNSAVANAHYQNEQNSELNVNLDALFVKSILIDGGTILKRMTPRAKGSGYKILKRTSHITIVMGQKVSPLGLRIGIVRDWDAKWYAPKDQVANLLHEDLKVRAYLENFYKAAYVSRIEIKRTGKRVIVVIHAAKPGVVIGTGGSKKNEAVKALQKITNTNVFITVVEIKQPDLDATLVARKMAEDLENRASFRRVQKMAIQKALKAGAKGIKTSVSGRLGGAEIARSEGYIEGSVPLHTLRANIDYATAEAATTYGKLGVKVYINKGEVLPAKKEAK